MSTYLNDWSASGEESMLSDFGVDASALDGLTVLVASYTYEWYEGDAYVLLVDARGELFEVHGSHCSCYGLNETSYSGGTSTQWKPEPISREALVHRLEHGYWSDEYKPGVKAAVVASLGL